MTAVQDLAEHRCRRYIVELLIKEADAMIDPGVDNAPHVAALPPEGWLP